MASQWEKIKWVPGTRLMVDGFGFVNAKCQHYFLTHMHSDHTTGLTKSFCAGTIYVSPISARLLDHEWGLRAPTVQVLQLGQPTVIEGVTVTAVDANHCPGAVMLLFEVPRVGGGVTTVLHTGDCRWQNHLKSNSCLDSKKVDILMLDTTYAVPRYTFPPQQQAIEMMVKVMQQTLQEEPASLFVVGSYHIGKERAYLGAAEALGLKVYASAAKRHLLQLLDMPQQQLQLVTDDAHKAAVHVGQLGVTPEKLQTYLKQPGSPWKRVVGFRPTGWSYKRSGGLQVWREGAVEVVGIPYSEHSSWNDLRDCVAALRPKKIIPTVNAANPGDASRIVERFADLMDHSSNRGRIDMHLLRMPTCTCYHLPSTVTAEAFMDKQHSADSSSTQARVPTSSHSPSVDAAEQLTVCSDGLGAVAAGMEIIKTVQPLLAAADSSLIASCPTVDVDIGLSEAVAVTAGACCEAADAGTHRPGHSIDMASKQGQYEEVVDLAAVDIAEQQRLLERAEQLQRLKRSRERLAAAKSIKVEKRRASLL